MADYGIKTCSRDESFVGETDLNGVRWLPLVSIVFRWFPFSSRSEKKEVRSIMSTVSRTIHPSGWTIVCISDTHAQLHRMSSEIPPGDVLIHAGDFSRKGEKKELSQFFETFRSLPHPVKLFIAGNHEITLDPVLFLHRADSWKHYFKPGSQMNAQTYHQLCRDIIIPPTTPLNTQTPVYLQDQSYSASYIQTNEEDSETPQTVDEIKFYGSPWQPKHFTMAFNLSRGVALAEKWRMIPPDVDVLITHTPPYQTLDQTCSGLHCGCEELSRCFDENLISPRLHVFGHIHEQHGKYLSLSLV